MSESFDLYESAITQADLYSRQGGVHPDFGSFMREPDVDENSVDTSVINNSTYDKEQFFKRVFASKYHVVYGGSYGANPFGPGNNIMFAFDQKNNLLRMARITQEIGTHELSPEINVTSNSITFTGGELDMIFAEVPHTYERQNNKIPSPVPGPQRIHMLQARDKDKKIVYTYFMVPIRFP